MSLPTTKAEKQAQLETFKPGANIVIEIEGKRAAVKFGTVTPAGRLRYTVSGKIGWADVAHYVGTPSAISDAQGHKANPEAMAAITKAAVALGITEPAPFTKAVDNAVAEIVKPKKKGDFVSIAPESGHKWEKQNLITLVQKGSIFDKYKCLNCGLEGNRYGVNERLEVTKKSSKKECLPLPVVTPLERGIEFVKLLVIGSNHPAYEDLVIGNVYPVIDSPEKKFAADVWIAGKGDNCRLFNGEWEKAEKPEAKKEPVALVSENAIEGVSEFGAILLRKIGAIENYAAAGGKSEPVSVAALAEQLGESPKKVAAGFVALNRIGAINQSGEKGARLVELTVKGWELIAEPEKAAPAPVAVIEEELPEAKFELSDEMIEAMKKAGREFTPIMDVYTANYLRTVHENRPDLVAFQESKTEDAYFDARLTDKAAEMIVWPEPAPEPEKVAEAAPKAKRAPRPVKELSFEEQVKEAQRRKAGREDGSGSKGGRPGAGVKPFRELVLDALQTLLLDNIARTPTQTAAALAPKLNVTAKQVQNAIWKLGRAAFLVVDSEGRVATPVELTTKGELGYKTNHGLNILPKVQEMIKEGKTDKEIALSLGCEPAYIHDVRSGRGRKQKEVEEAVTE